MSETETPTAPKVRGTAIAWGVILMLVAGAAWYFSTVQLAAVTPTVIVWNVIVIGAVLIGVALVGAIARAVTKKHPPVD